MREVVLDPEYLAAGVLGRARPRRLLGLFGYGRWAQYAELLGPAEAGLMRQELETGGRPGGPSIDALVEQAQDRRAVLSDQLSPGAPDDLVLVVSVPIIDAVEERVRRIVRQDDPERNEAQVGSKVRRTVAFLALGITDDLTSERPRTESLRDHLIHVSAASSAPLITDDPQLAPEDDRIWGHTDSQTGRPAYAVTSSTFIQRHVDKATFTLDSVPFELLQIAMRDGANPFDVGVRAGVARAERENLYAPDIALDESLSVARAMLSERDASDRFVELFSELATVAAIARSVYDDPPLSDEDVESYLEHAIAFFNSFRHA